MLLPRETPEEEDPRAKLAEAIARLAAAKKAAVTLGERYKTYSGRMVKDTDEIGVDKTYVADTDASRLYDAMRRMLTYARGIEDVADKLVRPIVARPIIPVHLKILGIMRHFETDDATPSLGELLDDADSRPDLVAIFIGVLELVRMRRLILIEKEDEFENLHGVESRFAINPNYSGNLVDDFDSSGYDA
jgi:chromatin segregation and condensation protein Rec8/ScpA/Scc1 (kleisin family)